MSSHNIDQSDEQLDSFGIDLSLLQLLINNNKELGPDVLKDSKFDPLLTPFDLEWSFGFDVSVPLINLSDEKNHQIFYSASNTGVLYDYCTKTMIHLRGHQNKVVSIAADRSGRWLGTADSGKDNVIMIWDTSSSNIVWTIFNHPGNGHDLIRIALSPSAKLLITISNSNSHTIDFWLWTYGSEKPDDSYSDDTNLGNAKAIEFHPNNENHIMIVFEKAVLFFSWDHEERKANFLANHKSPPSKMMGHCTDATYVDFCHECFVSTSKGYIVVFGNTIYSKQYDTEEGLDNHKMLIKSIKVSKGNVTCIVSVDEIIITGDSNGTIMFFDKRLKLLYWFTKCVVKPICCVSFKRCKRKYQLDFATSADVQEDVRIAECQDRAEEYEILMAETIPKDATLQKRLFITRDSFISTLDGTIQKLNFPRTFIQIFPTADSPVAAIEVHDELPHLIIAYSKRRITIFNYETHEEVISTTLPETDNESVVTALKYSPQCLHLACGTSNGELWLLQSASLAQIYVEPFRFGSRKIMKIAFSKSSLQMAYYDDNMTIFGFYYDTESEDWVFKGKVRSHYKEVCNILFLEEDTCLYTMGKDRHVIKYTDIVADEGELDINTRDRIEQKDIPSYFIPYPKSKFRKTRYFLEVDNNHKYKVISIKTNMCTAVYLGPAYGCFYKNPVVKMEFLPNSSNNYLIFMSKKQIGIQLMPIDGNPYRFIGSLAHPEELLDFKMSYDGRYIFTIGKNDRTVLMWQVNVTSVDTLFHLGGSELQPFYCLLEGGHSGFLYQEMRDLFYYMQILQQGEHVCAPRIVSNCINYGELPDLMRACGYYPSEYEIENLLTDIRYKDFDDTSLLKDKVTFCEFVKLFINHKPAYGYSVEQLEDCFETITTFTDEVGGSSMPRDDFLEAITTTGEQVSGEQIYRCLTTLLHEEELTGDMGERDFSFMPDDIDFYYLSEDILGIDMSTVEHLKNEDDASGSGGYGAYGYGYGYGYDND